jgi:hypothetical protein
VLARLKPEELQQCFLRWMQAVSEVTHGEVVAIDGKTLRRSFDRATGKGAIHMVSAWASANRLVLGQQRVDEKSNEIAAIPALLRLLEIKGGIVTIDAMGCQKAIARTIMEQEADYVLTLKASLDCSMRKCSSSLAGRSSARLPMCRTSIITRWTESMVGSKSGTIG